LCRRPCLRRLRLFWEARRQSIMGRPRYQDPPWESRGRRMRQVHPQHPGPRQVEVRVGGTPSAARSSHEHNVCFHLCIKSCRRIVAELQRGKWVDYNETTKHLSRRRALNLHLAFSIGHFGLRCTLAYISFCIFVFCGRHWKQVRSLFFHT
jgi:hypothetical protein